MDILQAQLSAQQEKKAYALVTLVKAEGVTPRGVGSKMVVFSEDHVHGSVGGGVLEKQVVRDAVRCIKNQETMLKAYENRAEEEGSPCGGVIMVFIDPSKAAPELVVCGAGHVGGCVVRVASTLGYRITMVDTRDTETTAENARASDALVLCEDFYGGVKSLEVGHKAFYLISTYGHAQDCDALAAALEKEAAYIGMLGSKTKIRTLFEKLREKGYSEEQLASVNTPVGLDIGGETPEEIAVSIVAEMQMVRYGKTGSMLKK